MVFPVYEEHALALISKRKTSSISIPIQAENNKKPEVLIPPSPDEDIPHHGQINEIFSAMRFVLLILGRFPFIPSYSPKNGQGSYKGLNYSWTLKSNILGWIYFGVTSVVLLILLGLSIISFLSVVLSWSFFSAWTGNQTKLFQSNLIPFVLIWSCLLSSTVGNISFLWNRKTVAKFLNYWNVSVDKLGVKLPKEDLRRFLHFNNLWFMIFTILTVVSTLALSIKLARGGSALMGLLALRTIIPNVDHPDYEWICRFLGMIILLYAMYSSRAFLFFFAFKCKLLRYCIRDWNSRLKAEIYHSGRPGSEELQKMEKLFHDHVILLRLARLTDKVFGSILLSYFGSQILNMCFELYYVAMSNTTTVFNNDGDGWDTFIAILLLIQNIYVFLSVSLHAAYVTEEANKGFEILKTKGISPHDSSAKRHLLLSLWISFQQKICITGGHYFNVDKPFIVTVLGTVVTYFIIIIQYGSEYSTAFHANYNSTHSHH